MNPYEMRFNYFQAAKDLLQQDYNSQLEKIMLSYTEESEKKTSMIQALKFPTREEIFKLAEEIKEFTNKQ